MFPDFEPHSVVRGGHLQTVVAAYFWRNQPYTATPVTVPMPDGDQLILHDDRPLRWVTKDGAALLIHGLAGCHGSGYMQRIAAKLSARGVRVFRMDMRGCGAGALTATRSVHAGRIEDLRSAVEAIRRCAPGVHLTCAGFSLGGSILLKMLGQLSTAALPLVDSAIAVSAPLDLAACSLNLSRGTNRLYDRSFVGRLLRAIRARRRAGVKLSHIDWDHAPRTLYEFDTVYTAKMGGFRGVDDYYEQCSCLPDLHRVCVPTYVLHADDDPLIPGSLYEAARFSDSMQVHRTRYGGHLGFLASRSGDPDWFWMDWRVVDLIVQANRQHQEPGDGHDSCVAQPGFDCPEGRGHRGSGSTLS